MHVSQPTPAKKDDLLGICAALGEDLGFNPIYLRIALGAGLLWNPVAIVGGYLLAGVFVLASRLLFPKPKTIPPTADVVAIDPAPRAAPAELPLAA